MTDAPISPARSRGTRERLASTAARLFYRNGINATGVEAVIQQAKMSKRTLYQYFSSKNDLVENYLRTIDETRGTPVELGGDRPDLSPRDRMLAIFDASPVDQFRGCPFHNAAVESAGMWSGVDEIVRANKLRFAEQLVALAEEAGAADPYQLGHQLLVLFEGAASLATSLNDTAPFLHARSAAAQLIDGAVVPNKASSRTVSARSRKAKVSNGSASTAVGTRRGGDTEALKPSARRRP